MRLLTIFEAISKPNAKMLTAMVKYSQRDWEEEFRKYMKSTPSYLHVDDAKGGWVDLLHKFAELVDGSLRGSETSKSLYVIMPKGFKLRMSDHAIIDKRQGRTFSFGFGSARSLLLFQLNRIIHLFKDNEAALNTQ